MSAKYRLGRAGLNGNITWKPWKTGKLYVMKTDKDYPKAKKISPDSWRKDSILIVTPEDENTAEFHQRNYEGSGLFCNEDYYMEIAGLE